MKTLISFSIKNFLINWISEKRPSTPCFICLPQGIGGKLFNIMHYEIVNGFCLFPSTFLTSYLFNNKF
jgi:hypothetical protein